MTFAEAIFDRIDMMILTRSNNTKSGRKDFEPNTASVVSVAG
jgi:hypothetical protein